MMEGKYALDESLPVALYEQLAYILRSKIKNNEFKPNDMLPTELELMKAYHVSRTTVRQALLSLAREGLVYRKRGKGTFVNHPRVIQQLVTLRSFTEEIKILGFAPGAKLVGKKHIDAEQAVAEHLGINIGDPVLKIDRLRYADEKELSYNRSFIPKKFAGALEEEDLGCRSLYTLIEQKIGRITRAKETITAVSASETTAGLLKVKEGSPMLRLERVTFLSGGVPVEYVRVDFRPDRYMFVVDLKR